MIGPRVLKTSPLPDSQRQSTHTVGLPLRIPGRRVHFGEENASHESLTQRQVAPPRVVRSIDVANAAPVELALANFSADFPVSPPGSDHLIHQEAGDEGSTAAMEARWKARLEAEVRQAREEGYQSGYDQARSELVAEYRDKGIRLLEDAARLAVQVAGLVERSEGMLVDLAFSIAKAVVDSPLLVPARHAAVDAIGAAVERLAGQHPVRIRMHPVDYLRFQEAGLVDQLGSIHAELRWEPDATMMQGDWTVETPEALIRRLGHEIIEDLRERLGMLAAEHHRPTGDES